MSDPATGDPWARLIAARAAGEFSEEGVGASRHLIFADGSVWFPEVHAQESSGGAVFPLLGVMFVGCLGGAIVGWHDGASWAWYFAGGLVLSGALIYLAARAANRAQAALERQLATGLFLLDDALIIREAGFDRRVARESLASTSVRRFRGGGSSSVERIDLHGRDGAVTHTDLCMSARPVVDAWIAGADGG